MYVSLPRAPQISMTHFWTTKMGKSQPKHKSQLSLRPLWVTGGTASGDTPTFLKLKKFTLNQYFWPVFVSKWTVSCYYRNSDYCITQDKMAHKKDIRCFMIQPCVQYITHTSGSFIIQWFKLEPKCKDISSTIHLYHLIGDFYNVEGKKMILFSLSDPFPSLFRLQLYPADGYHGARLLRQLRISGYKFLCCVQVNMSFSQSDLYQTVSFFIDIIKLHCSFWLNKPS